MQRFVSCRFHKKIGDGATNYTAVASAGSNESILCASKQKASSSSPEAAAAASILVTNAR